MQVGRGFVAGVVANAFDDADQVSRVQSDKNVDSYRLVRLIIKELSGGHFVRKKMSVLLKDQKFTERTVFKTLG